MTLSQEIIQSLINMIEIIFLFQSLKIKNNLTFEQASYKIITIELDGVCLSHFLNNLLYYLMNSMRE